MRGRVGTLRCRTHYAERVCVCAAQVCCETLWSNWLWRIGVPRISADLHIEMARIVGNCGAACTQLPYPSNTHAEAAHRRMPNRSGHAARFSRYGPRMQGYCAEDAAFARFGDGSVLRPHTPSQQVAATSKGPGTTSAIASTVFTKACTPFPPCNGTVDLSAQPLAPCVRAHIGQRVTMARGYGEEVGWPTGASTQQTLSDAAREARPGDAAGQRGHGRSAGEVDPPAVVYFPGGREPGVHRPLYA
jgi:hypothetical protein